MTKVAILGGGPGGLMTAYQLERKHRDSCQIALFEASGRTGGKIVTTQFDSAPVIYEAGAAEFYNYAMVGPDPLLELIEQLGLKTVPMSGQTVILDGKILRNKSDIRRLCGRATLDAIEEFRKRCAEAMPKADWYEGTPHFDNTHPWAGRTCADVLDDVPDETARKYLQVAVHSDLATEPHLTNGLNGLKNFLMDVPGYLHLYSVNGGNQRVLDLLRQQLTNTRIETDCPVTRVEKNPDESYRVFYRRAKTVTHQDFDAVFTALPHNCLGTVEWGGAALRKAMAGFIAYYDRPGHYLRVTILFRKPFWREAIGGSWFMLDAFGGCCVYDESARHDAGEYGVLSWLIAGTDALSLSNFDDQTVTDLVLDSLPEPLRAGALSSFLEAKVHRWMASVNAQPGGIPVRDTRSSHMPEPKGHPGLFMVGDYLFDSTLNGVLDSADFATDFFQSWRLKQELMKTAASPATRKVTRSYFDNYHYNLSYEDSYDWYFDPKYVRDLIKIVWKAKPPYRLLDAGAANGLTLPDFAGCGIEAWGVENNKYIHSRTAAKWRKRNLRGDIRKLPFPDGYFAFVYETCLAHIPEDQLGFAIRELHRVCRRGVIFASLTSDMNPELFKRDLLMGVTALMPTWEWGELFTANGFGIAATDVDTLDRLWRCEEKYNEGDDPWYPDRDSLRYCFYTKLPAEPRSITANLAAPAKTLAGAHSDPSHDRNGVAARKSTKSLAAGATRRAAP
jgi:monoamine oxidase/SAM-dependent methyltransferase